MLGSASMRLAVRLLEVYFLSSRKISDYLVISFLNQVEISVQSGQLGDPFTMVRVGQNRPDHSELRLQVSGCAEVINRTCFRFH